MELDLQIAMRDGMVVATLIGELGATTTEHFADELEECVAGEGARLVLDLSQVDMIDSRGLSAMINLVTRARLSQGRVILVGPKPLVAGVLNVTRLDTWFEICDSIESATDALS